MRKTLTNKQRTLALTLAALGAVVNSANAEDAVKQGQSFLDCDGCPVMVIVPAGSFLMGSSPRDPVRDPSEEPQRQIVFEQPFAVGKYAVSFAEWDACVADGGCGGYRPEDQGWGRGGHPVTNVSWDDAHTYTVWLSHKAGETYRLLTEAEREYVTRAGTTTPYWWGSAISPARAHYNPRAGAQSGEAKRKTERVSAFPANPWGLHQVSGNVWEWVEDCWNETYDDAPADSSAWMSGDCASHVLRGGSSLSFGKSLRSASRFHYDNRSWNIGFRIARELAPPPTQKR
jgi:formylglycine-generating enzyme required for sulfatase activity